MPNPGATRPLHRTNINLFVEDVEFFKTHFGQGWSNEVREYLHDWVIRMSNAPKAKPTLGDLTDD